LNIAIIDYGLGNVASVAGALNFLGASAILTCEVSELRAASKLILPGVGAFADGMGKLRKRGLIEPLAEIVGKGTPILGICLGAQLLCRSSEEFGHHEGLGWINGDVRRLRSADSGLRLPHVGWNELRIVGASSLLDGIADRTLLYYCHSYAIQVDEPEIAIGFCDYGETFVAAFQSKNVFGIQPHPEKSQRAGLDLLKNFLNA
jgi:imidazole glycerol-phosphate synthase subunit HisH